MTPRKSACLLLYHFRDDSPIYKLVQNAQLNLQHHIDGYDKSVFLKTDYKTVGQSKPTVLLKPNVEVFLGQIVQLTKEGYYIDIRICTHGGAGRILCANDRDLTVHDLVSQLAHSETGYRTYPIRSVYGVHCYGQSFNQTWLDLGAKVAVGARHVNFYPNQANWFEEQWRKGNVGVDEAVRESNTESSRTVMQGLILADAATKFNFKKCWPGQTVLGDAPCAESYFDENWGLDGEWQDGQSGKDNMNYSSYMFRGGQKTLTRNDTASLTW